MLFADFESSKYFEIKLVEVGYYNSTNQDPPIPKMTSERDFPYFEKSQAKLISVRLNEKYFAHEPCVLYVLNPSCLFLLKDISFSKKTKKNEYKIVLFNLQN